jgi:hypothetical protein
MRRLRKSAELIILTAALFLIYARNAFAYIDPGTGSFVLQLIIGALLGAAFAVKSFWKNIKAFFSKLLSRG